MEPTGRHSTVDGDATAPLPSRFANVTNRAPHRAASAPPS